MCFPCALLSYCSLSMVTVALVSAFEALPLNVREALIINGLPPTRAERWADILEDPAGVTPLLLISSSESPLSLGSKAWRR